MAIVEAKYDIKITQYVSQSRSHTQNSKSKDNAKHPTTLVGDGKIEE